MGTPLGWCLGVPWCTWYACLCYGGNLWSPLWSPLYPTSKILDLSLDKFQKHRRTANSCPLANRSQLPCIAAVRNLLGKQAWRNLTKQAEGCIKPLVQTQGPNIQWVTGDLSCVLQIWALIFDKRYIYIYNIYIYPYLLYTTGDCTVALDHVGPLYIWM